MSQWEHDRQQCALKRAHLLQLSDDAKQPLSYVLRAQAYMAHMAVRDHHLTNAERRAGYEALQEVSQAR